jgi:multicomponent Na+:H+ antiporter subunit D
MNGAGRRMPWTSIAFSVAAFGMMGAPLTAGYISKLYLIQGAEMAEMVWVSWMLTASSLLNAAYFLPILYRLWFVNQPQKWLQERIRARGRWETHGLLLIPPVVTAAVTLGAGIFADTGWSPLFWVKLVAEMEYLP